MNIHTVDLKLLRVFLTVVRCGGFAAAQGVLNVGQSTISEQIRHLETRLGVRLCERGRSGFYLTEKGMATVEAAQRLLAAVDAFVVDTQSLKQTLTGEMAIGVIDNTITNREGSLQRPLQRFLARAHDVHIKVYIGTPAELCARVLGGHLQVALGHFPSEVAGLQYHELYTESNALYCSRDHPMAQPALEPADLLRLLARSRVVAREFLRQMDLKKLGVVKACAAVDNVEAQALLILTGYYIGYLPVHYAQAWVDTGELCRIAPALFDEVCPFCAITKRALPASALLDVFLTDMMHCLRSPAL